LKISRSIDLPRVSSVHVFSPSCMPLAERYPTCGHWHADPGRRPGSAWAVIHGQISGTPTSTGTTRFTVQAADNKGHSDTADFWLRAAGSHGAFGPPTVTVTRTPCGPACPAARNRATPDGPPRQRMWPARGGVSEIRPG
jgi:hypothetical protein